MPLAMNTDYLFVNGISAPFEHEALLGRAQKAREMLLDRCSSGGELTGWLNPDKLYEKKELERLRVCAERIAGQSDVVLVAAIGGSYLGARAVEFLGPHLGGLLNKKGYPRVLFVGNNLSELHLAEVLSACNDNRVSVIVTSKSGMTLEVAVAFRIIKRYMNDRYGKEAKDRIVAIMGRDGSGLKDIAEREGYETFTIPKDIGGRYSVLTPVGLLPVMAAGYDGEEMIRGAADSAVYCAGKEALSNDCLKYAAARQMLYEKGLPVELFCAWDPCLASTAEWLKQLFGESHGKDGKGLFPASANYTADLHSLGQFVQDGRKILFETQLSIKDTGGALVLPKEENNADGLNYLAGITVGDINGTAVNAVLQAHFEGGVPSIVFEIADRSPYEYGWMVYFFEFACAVGGYMLGVNPFNQPGVELYKRNMRALMGVNCVCNDNE